MTKRSHAARASAALALTAAFAAAPLFAAPVQAKTLVYCSEGSPENFNPMINTTGTTFDANRPIYNRLVEFKIGTTQIEAGLSDKWESTEDGKVFTFHIRRDAKWQSNKN